MLTQEQRDFLLPKACDAALKAGAAILEVYAHEDHYHIDIKRDMTPITLADRRAHEVIKGCLGQTLIPVLSEEGREMLYDERKGWDLFWMVDPLDGTKEFIKGNGEFTVNIALMSDNRPVLSVVYVPFISKLYFADRLSGSFRKEGIKAADDTHMGMTELMEGAARLPVAAKMNDPLRIAMSRSHNNEATFAYVEKVRMAYPDAEVVEQGSSYKLCLTAEGSVEYYARTSDTYEWDTAAGELIVELSGGSLRTMDGGTLLYNKESLLNPWFVCKSKYMK